MPVIRGARCVNIPDNEFSRVSYNMSSRNIVPRGSMMNTGRFRSRGFCNRGCIDNTMPTWFKNSVNNIYLARVSTASRITNALTANAIRGMQGKVEHVCVNRQYGRRCGSGGTGPANKF